MYVTTGTIASLGLALGASLLVGCGSEARGGAPTSPAGDSGSIVERAPEYTGDPAEKQFREEFWGKHIHDSWNKCHIGEGVVPRKPQPGEDCWDRLRPQTGR